MNRRSYIISNVEREAYQFIKFVARMLLLYLTNLVSLPSSSFRTWKSGSLHQIILTLSSLDIAHG